jgi:two-component system cell cycle response regulator
MHDTARVLIEREESEPAEPRWRRTEQNGFGLVAINGGEAGWAALREDDGRPMALLRAARHILQLEAELAATRRELDEQSARDPVTRLWNRAVALDLLVAERARSRRARQSIGLFLLDVDGLAAIDQRLGRIACDEVLRAVCRRIAGALRPYDLMARYGESTFLVIAPGVASASMATVVERMTEGMAEPIAIADGSSLEITCSCGAVSAPYDWTGGQEALLALARDAVLRARSRGVGRMAVVDPSPRTPRPPRR